MLKDRIVILFALFVSYDLLIIWPSYHSHVEHLWKRADFHFHFPYVHLYVMLLVS